MENLRCILVVLEGNEGDDDLLEKVARLALAPGARAEPTHYEAVVRRAMRGRPDLVVKRVSAKRSGRQSMLSASDWQAAAHLNLPAPRSHVLPPTITGTSR